MTLSIFVDFIWEKSLMMGFTAESCTQDLNRGSLCLAPGLRKIFPKIIQTVPLCCKPSSSLYHLCRLSWSQPYYSFQPIHLDTSFPFLRLTIITHFPSWKVSPVNLLSTSASQSYHFSFPEDNGQWHSPAALSSCVVWQRSLQLAASCSVLSGYDHCQQHLDAKHFLVSTEHIQNVIVKSWKWYKTVLHLGFKSQLQSTERKTKNPQNKTVKTVKSLRWQRKFPDLFSTNSQLFLLTLEYSVRTSLLSQNQGPSIPRACFKYGE